MLRILEVGIGLALVFTLVALICSVINEWVSAMLEKRGNLLWEGIENLVDRELRDDICKHRLMQGLVRKQTWFDMILKRIMPWVDRAKPSYVPTEMFVATLLDVIGTRAATAGGNPNSPTMGQLPTTFTGLQEVIQKAGGVPDNVKQALLALVNNAADAVGTAGAAGANELAKAKKYIGDWFDAGMGRVTGWYKRWSQIVLLVVSLIVAFSLGVDCIAISKRLWTDPILRDQVANAAQKFVEENQMNQRLAGSPAPDNTGTASVAPLTSDLSLTSDSNLTTDVPLTSDAPLTTDSTLTAENPPTSDQAPAAGGPSVAATVKTEDLAKKKLKEIQVFQNQLEALALPMFPMTGLGEEYKSNHSGAASSLPWMFGWWLWHHLLGFLLTALAASLGAPFWFDVLNRFVNLRNTGKKPDETPATP